MKPDRYVDERLRLMRHAGIVGAFTVTVLDDGMHVRVAPGESAPPDLRAFLGDALGVAVGNRIEIE